MNILLLQTFSTNIEIKLIKLFPVLLPLAFGTSWGAEKIGLNLKTFPLYFYRSASFYVMRTDSRDRFGTPLEKRFTKKEIYKMMKQSGLERIKFKNIIICNFKLIKASLCLY